MVAKFVIVLSLAAVAYAGLLPATKVVYAEPEAPAQYDFSYSVQDTHTGDLKQQQESRAGDAVRGSYSLVQPDGVQRIVEYSADEHQGFNAVVRYEGSPTKVIAAAPVAKLAYAAPVAKVAYAAPVARVSYAAPVARVAYAAPVTRLAYNAPIANVAYAAPVARVSYAAPVARVAYAAPVTRLAYNAPIANVAYAAPVSRVAYGAAPLAQVSYSSPVVSYQH